MEKRQLKQSESGWNRSAAWAALSVALKAGAMSRPLCITSLTAAGELATWKRYRFATQVTIRELRVVLAKSVATPTKQHLKPDTAPRNSSSS